MLKWQFAKSQLIVAVVAAIILVSALTGIYIVSETGTTSQTLTTSTLGYTNNSTLGLKLELSINSGVINPGEGLLINVSEYNTLERINNVTAMADWPVSGLSRIDGHFKRFLGATKALISGNSVLPKPFSDSARSFS